MQPGFLRQDVIQPVKDRVKRTLAKRGIALVYRSNSDMEPEFWNAYERSHVATMTSVERMYALHRATGYVVRAGVPGAIVECGVWRGGSSMMAALTLMSKGDTSRELWLYDTFEGMPEPTESDIAAPTGASARRDWESAQRGDHNAWCYASVDEVRANMGETRYPQERLHFIKGKVEDTIPGDIPEEIAILRLDTDWYESTRHELEYLFPRLVPGGVLILDDYGYWAGARKAVDEYFAEHGIVMLLSRIDDTGRMGIKPGA
jgi:O-methyltransferase